MDAMTQLQDFFKQKYREEAEAEVVRRQLERRRRDESSKQRKLSQLYTKYQALSSGVGEQLSNVENMDKTVDSKIVGLHKAQTLMLDQTNTMHLQVKSQQSDLEKAKFRAPVATHADIDAINDAIAETDKENCSKQQRIRTTRKKIKSTEISIAETRKTILGEQNTRQSLTRDEAALTKKQEEHERDEKELTREVRALDAVMRVQSEASEKIKGNLETLENEIDELKRAADTSKNEEYNALKAEIKAKNLQQRDAVRLKQKLQAESEQAEKDFAELKPDLDKITASHVQREDVVVKLRAERESVEQQNADIEADLKKQQEALRELESAHESLTDDYSVESYEKELKKLKTSITRHMKKTESSEAKLEKVRGDLKTLEDSDSRGQSAEHEEATQQVEAQDKRISDHEQEIKDAEARLVAEGNSREGLVGELEELVKVVEGLEKSIGEADQKFKSEQESAAARDTDRQSLEEAQQQFEREIEAEEKRIEEYEAENKRRQQQFEASLKEFSEAHDEHIKELEAMFEKQKLRKQKLADEFKAQNEAHERQKNEIAARIRAVELELQRMEDDGDAIAGGA